MGDPAPIYDNNQSEEPITRPKLGVIEGGGESTSRKTGHLKSVGGETKTPEQLAGLESNPAEAGHDGAAARESDLLGGSIGDKVGKGYTSGAVTGGKSKPKVRFLTRNRALIGGGAIGGTVATVTIFSILQGPFQIIHFMQWLHRPHMSANNEFSNSRATKLWRIVKYPKSPEMRRLGSVLNRSANKVETRWREAGFEPKYDGPNNRLDRFVVKAGVDVSAFEAAGVKVTDIGGGLREIKFDEALYSKRGRKVFNQISKASGYNEIISSINTRVLAKRAGVSFKLFDNIKKRPEESFPDYYKRVRDRLSNYYDSGSLPRVRSVADDGPDQDTTPDPNNQSEADAGNRNADDVETKFKEGGVNSGRLATREKLDKGDGVIGMLCIVRAVGENYPKLQYSRIILPLIRQGTSIMSMGSQVMAGKGLNINELGAISAKLYSDTEVRKGVKEGSWTSAKSIQAEMGNPQTGLDIMPYAKPSRVGNNPIANTINNISGNIPFFGTTCRLQSNPLGGFVTSAITGGVAGVITDLAIDKILQAFDIDIVGFLTRLIAGKGVDADAAGSTLGNFANYGARLAANDQALAVGGQELETAEESALDEEGRLAIVDDLSNVALSERLFSLENPDSLISRVGLSGILPKTYAQGLTKLIEIPTMFWSGFAGMFSSIGSRPVLADTINNGYDYGFKMYGFTQAERDDPKNDPDKIADELARIIKNRTVAEESCERRGHGSHPPSHECNYVPSNVTEFNSLYERCFGVRIIEADPADPNSVEKFEQLQSVNYFSNEGPESRPQYCESGQPDTEEQLTTSQTDAANDLRLWRFYIADTVIGHSIACYEGEEASCKLFGFADSSSSSTVSGSERLTNIRSYHDQAQTVVDNRRYVYA